MPPGSASSITIPSSFDFPVSSSTFSSDLLHPPPSKPLLFDLLSLKAVCTGSNSTKPSHKLYLIALTMGSFRSNKVMFDTVKFPVLREKVIVMETLSALIGGSVMNSFDNDCLSNVIDLMAFVFLLEFFFDCL